MRKNADLTEGSISGKLILFAFPLMIGNLLQQFYNIVDTLVVGRYLGENALAAVGSAYTLMIFITSVISGLCMGSGVYFSIQFGKKSYYTMKQSYFISFMNIPNEVIPLFKEYLGIIFTGILASFLYNFFANLLRASGNSVIPLIFLAVSAIVNVALDLLFILHFHWGVAGAAAATVIAQYIAGIGIMLYYFLFCNELKISRIHIKWSKTVFSEIAGLSAITCIQQSIMNLGILMVQGLVNSFGTVVMAAFAAGVKVDTVAYAPVQDFGNAFSTFIAQNYGAGKRERIRKGVISAGAMVIGFCIAVSCIIYLFADKLMSVFVDGGDEVIRTGVGYLHIEGICYVGIGILFLLYGYYRAVKKPMMSVILTIISLGTRVVIAYFLSSLSGVGVNGIWLAIPLGWFLADVTGILFGLKKHSVYK